MTDAQPFPGASGRARALNPVHLEARLATAGWIPAQGGRWRHPESGITVALPGPGEPNLSFIAAATAAMAEGRELEPSSRSSKKPWPAGPATTTPAPTPIRRAYATGARCPAPPDTDPRDPDRRHPQLPRRNQDSPKEARRHDQQANARPQGLPDRPAQPAHQRRPPAEDPAHPDAARGCQGRAQGPTGRLTEGKPPRNRRRQQPTEGRKRRRSPLTRPRDHRTPPGRRYRRLRPAAGSRPPHRIWRRSPTGRRKRPRGPSGPT